MLFRSILPNLERRYHETGSYPVREEIENYMSIRPCPACEGARLKPVSLAVQVGEKSINEITALSVEKAYQFFQDLKLGAKERMIAKRVLKEIGDRLGFLESVGLDYLPLTALPPPFQELKISASDLPHRLVRAWPVFSMSWMNPA